MRERIILTPLQARITLLNEVFVNQTGGHYSPEIAQALHPYQWEDWYTENGNPIEPYDYYGKGKAGERQLLIETVGRALHSLPSLQLEQIIQLRFGLVNGILYTREELGETFGLTRGRIGQIELKALRMLRHPSRGKPLRDFLDKPNETESLLNCLGVGGPGFEPGTKSV